MTRKLLVTSDFELISPTIALEELKKYSKEIINKTNISIKQFDLELSRLRKIVNFINKSQYSSLLKDSEKISPDKSDADFLALCLKFDCFLWSNDFVLKRQDKVKVLSTEEIIELLF